MFSHKSRQLDTDSMLGTHRSQVLIAADLSLGKLPGVGGAVSLHDQIQRVLQTPLHRAAVVCPVCVSQKQVKYINC